MSNVDPTRCGFVVERQHERDAVILTLSGELDLLSSSLLEDEIEAAEAAGRQRIVIDLRTLGFIDSVGLTVLLRTQRRSLETGHDISLLRGPPAVHRIFELTDTAALFAFGDTGLS